MNVVREISRINQAELDIAINNPSASWHQQYNDSAYIFIGGLPYDLTEGDVVAIFSQYGEVIDVNLPRANPNPGDKGNNADRDGAASSSSSSQQAKPVGKGKHRGFGFLMYEDQRSTVLAVDNLNGAQVLGRTLRVDHVAAYKQPKVTDEEGNRVDAEVKSFNAAPPELGLAGGPDDHDDDAEQDADLDDPMAAYFQQRRREERGKSKHDGLQPDDHEKEEKRRRKEERARIRAERKERRRNVSHSHSHREDDDRNRKRHRSHRREHDRDEGSQEPEVNRYEQMKKSRSVLDTNRSEARDSSSPRPRLQSRSITPPRSSRHRSERSSRDQDARRDDKSSHRRHEERDSRRGHGRSGDRRRRSRSP